MMNENLRVNDDRVYIFGFTNPLSELNDCRSPAYVSPERSLIFYWKVYDILHYKIKKKKRKETNAWMNYSL